MSYTAMMRPGKAETTLNELSAVCSHTCPEERVFYIKGQKWASRMRVGQVGLEEPKVGGDMVVKPLQVDILGPEPDQYIVRGFNCIRVTTF